MNIPTDSAGKVRQQDALPIDKLTTYLRQKIPALVSEATLNVRQFRGGASNLTYLLSTSNIELILRKPPSGTKAKSAHNMERESAIMQRIKPFYPQVPKVIHYCEDTSIIGSDFYIMEKITGFIPRAKLPKGLSLSEVQVSQMCKSAIDKLVALHSIDYKEAGFESYYKGNGYVQRQLQGWIKRFKKAQTPDVTDCKLLINWLETNAPPDVAPCIIHNDFRFDNLVYDTQNMDNIVGVLDWEMATVGDPLMELGNSLAYWIEADDPYCMQLLRRQPTHLPGMMLRDEVVQYYLEKMNFSPATNIKFYYLFGIFRLVGIIQQIYYRYYHRQTTNKQFAIFGIAINMLNKYCLKVIKHNSSSLSGSSLSVVDNLKYTALLLLKSNGIT